MRHRAHVWASAIKPRARSTTRLHFQHCLRRLYSSSSDADPAHDIAILGGGISGLASAYYITKALPKAKITIYESQDRLGGWIKSTRVPVKDGTILFESASRTLRPQGNGSLSVRLLKELDLAKDAIYVLKAAAAARNRYIYYPNRLVRMPHPSDGLLPIVNKLLTEPALATLWYSLPLELIRPQRHPSLQDESIGSFLSRRVSRTVVDRLASAMMHGIYAGDVWELSAKSLLSTAWRLEETAGGFIRGALQARGSSQEMTRNDSDFIRAMQEVPLGRKLTGILAETSVFTLKDGLYMLADRLAHKLVETGRVAFKTSTTVTQIASAAHQSRVQVTESDRRAPTEFTHVVSTLPPWLLGSIHKSPPGAAPLIPKIPTVTTMVVNLYYRTPGLNPPGFGYLIPQATPFEQNPERALGVIFDSGYAPDADHVMMAAKAQKEGLRPNMQDVFAGMDGFALYDHTAKLVTQDDVKATGTKLTVMLGGHLWDGWPAYPSEEEGLAMAKSVLKRHLNINEEPEVWQVQLNKNCIPQYTVGHEERLQSAHNNLWREYRGRLRVAGNWMRGVGVNDSLRSAWEATESLKKGRDGTGLEHVGSTDYVVMEKAIVRNEEDD